MRVRRIGTLRGMSLWCLAFPLIGVGCLATTGTRAATRGGSSATAEAYLPVPADLQPAIERASALGANLFLLDASTALAWDALATRIGPPNAAGVGHYLALIGGNGHGQPDGSVQVLFFTDEYVPRLAYRVRVSMGKAPRSEVMQLDPPMVVHEPLMTLLNARLLALEALPTTKQALNPVVIPQRNGRIVVYLLGATRERNVAVLGRHYRVEVSPDGTEVESVTALSGAELELPTEDRSGHRVSALAITDAAATHPTETHVFASRMANLPIYVTTGRGRWKVKASAIEYLGKP
jgi:hypothetical protein